MDPAISWAREKHGEFKTFVRALVECESPSDNAAAVERCADVFAAHVSDIAAVRKVEGSGGYGPHLLCEFHLPGFRKEGQILVLGHSDTVYDLGTLTSMPFREENGRVYGPGVFDMKGGLALFAFAMRYLVEQQLPVARHVVLQVNSDEETGSRTSRALTEAQARKSLAVLVVEPAAGLNGLAKTARKGVGGFRLQVRGRAAHAGLDFASGASAILELSRQIQRVSEFTDLHRGLTVNPGVTSGGARTNVVAAEAWCDFDVRVARTSDWEMVARRFRTLEPLDPRCTLEVTGELNRPPLERTEESGRLYQLARGIGAELGTDLGETTVGGGSDGNFTGALGIPTLDGMGAVGDGAHTLGEYILESRVPDRIALLAKLIQAI